MVRVALDSNILVYLAGLERADTDGSKIAQARRLLAALAPVAQIVLAAQAIGETYNVLVTKGKWSRPRTRSYVSMLGDFAEIAATDAQTMIDALRIADEHDIRIWDAVIIAVAAETKCRVLVSEDMHSGFGWRSATILTPFGADPDRALATLLTRITT